MAIPVLANFLIIWKKKEVYGDKLVKVSFFTGILLTIQGIAGAITVKFDNADWSVALHLGLASTFVFILIWQYVNMRKKEGAEWATFSAPVQFKDSEYKRLVILTSAIFLLLIMGAWVSSSANGNQGCSVGFPDGWPKCQGDFLPSLDSSGILVQMVHRLGAGVVGIALILGGMRLREKTTETGANKAYSNFLDASTGFWLLNVLIGGMYVVFAKMGGFPEKLSLLHLVIGVVGFLSASIGLILLQSSEGVGEDE
jgi:heme A synthase